MSITIADVEAARRTIAGQVLRTPMLPAPKLSALTAAEVYVKYENLQVTNSFKDRGALNKLASLSAAERGRGVIAMSAGNHAQAVAYHAARLAIPATIVMPVTTPFVKVEATQAHGAEVVLDGETVAEAQVRAETIARERGLTFVHPYDDPLVIAGQGTIALEMLEDAPALDALVVPIGGGGLIAGSAIAARARKPAIEIVGAEAALYPSFWNALHGENRPLGGATLAEGIAVKNVGVLAADRARTRVRDHLGRRGASRARGQCLSDPAEDHGRRRRRRRACRHAGRAGKIPRPQGRTDPVRRQHRCAHSRLRHGARARAREPHRLLPVDHPRPARRARANRHPARPTRRQHPRGRASPALPRCAGEGRQARRHGGDARPGAWGADLQGAHARGLPAGVDRYRDHDGVTEMLPVGAFSLQDFSGRANHPRREC